MTTHPPGSAFVTGGSRGIGRAIVEALAAAGWPVAFTFRAGSDAAEAVCAALRSRGANVTALPADNADPQALTGALDRAASALGPVAVLVCNAGIATAADWRSLGIDAWREAMRVNLDAAFVASQHVLPGMVERGFGRLVYLSSVAARNGGIVSPAYAASKAGVEGLMHHYAARLGAHGVTANAIAPGLIETDMLSGLPAPTADRLPLKRLGTAGEVAAAAALLVANGYITGQTLHVDGGLVMS